MDINSGSTKESSHRHIITRSLLTMDICDDKFRNYHKHYNGAGNFVMISILYVEIRRKEYFFGRILCIIREYIYTIKAMLPDILSGSEFLPNFATFQSYIAFHAIKHLKNKLHRHHKIHKHKQAHRSPKYCPLPHIRGLHPYCSTVATTLSVVALRHYGSNTGQFTVN